MAKKKGRKRVSSKATSSPTAVKSRAISSSTGPSDGDRIASHVTFPVVAVLVLLGALVLFQGGYYAGAAAIVGCGAAIALVGWLVYARSRPTRTPIVPVLFLLLACVYAVSACVSGLTATTVLETVSWFAVAGVAFLAAQVDADARASLLRGICWLGVVCAAVGMLMYAQVLPLAGSVNAGRLQFTFQYANAAGAWFAVAIVLCMLSNDARLRASCLLPLVALLLTQSAGALVVAFGACVMGIAVFLRRGQGERASLLVCQMAIALALFAACRLTPDEATTAWLVVAVVACWASWKYADALAKLDVRIVIGAAAVLVVAGIVAVCAMESGRVQQALQTFVERLIQVMDAFTLLAAHPVLGIGPDTWRYEYPYAQSAQYTASVVHCSFMQMLLDVGIVGFAVFAAAVVTAMRSLAQRGQVACLVASVVLLVHCLVDFDLQFAALAALLAVLLIDGEGPQVPHMPGRIVCGVSAAVVFAVCAWGVAVDSQRTHMESCAQQGDADGARMLIQDALLSNDATAQTAYVQALVRAGDNDAAIAFYDECGTATGEMALVAAEALFNSGEPARAGTVLVDLLEREPYQVDLFDQAARLFEMHGLDESVAERYRAAVDQANELARSGRAAWLSGQETVAEVS